MSSLPSVFVLIKPFPTAAAAGRQAEMYIMDTEHFSRVDTKAVSVLMTNSVNCKPQTGSDWNISVEQILRVSASDGSLEHSDS